jgi:hypothetical protein
MAEADPEAAHLSGGLPAFDRTLAWAWRAVRRARADGEYTQTVALGAAAGAGLGLGLLRFLTALLTSKTPGLFFVLNVFFGALLGGAVTLGYLIARPLLLLPLEPSAEEPAEPAWRQPILTVLVGVLVFGLAQMIVIGTTGRLSLSGKGAVFGLGLAAGLGLCLALYLPLRPPFWERPRNWPLRLAVVALLFAALQGVFIYFIDPFSSLVILLPAADYRANFVGFAWASAFPGWYQLLAILDALLAGAVLTAGLLTGARLADRFYRSWRRP